MREGWMLLLLCVAKSRWVRGDAVLHLRTVFSGAHPRFRLDDHQVHSGLSVFFLTNMALIPLVGWLADRFGAKRVALISLVLFSFSFMSLGLLDGRLVSFRIGWFLIAATGTGTMVLTWTRVIGAAFVAARDLALGIAFLGTGVAGVFCPPLGSI